MIKTAYQVIQEQEGGQEFLDKLQRYEINQLELIKADTTPEIAEGLTAFNYSSETGNACVSPDLSPFDLTGYHNGEGAYPTPGDLVFQDPQGEEPLILATNGQQAQMANLAYLATLLNGEAASIICK